MPSIPIATGALLGGLTSLPLIALLYLGNRLAGFPFVPFDLFDWLARVLPGSVVTFGIDSIVGLIGRFGLGATDETAKRMEGLLAIGLVVIGGVLFGAGLAWAMRRRAPTTRRAAVARGTWAGVLLFAVVALLEWGWGIDNNVVLALFWLAFLYVGWGALLGLLFVRVARAAAPARSATGRPSAARRTLLIQIAAGSLGLAVVVWAVDRLLGRQVVESGAGQPLAQGDLVATPDATPTPDRVTPPVARIEPAPGTRPEITPNAEFYRIDINVRPPTLNRDEWQLATAGHFANARTLTLADLLAFPAVTVPLTLSCISNRIGGDLISASNWTGLRLRDLLAELTLQADAQALRVEAADGFYEYVTMADMLDPRTLLVYGMNDATLPVEHGFPLRIYIPNRYGMKQPKWITRIEAVEAADQGYWVERGWSQEARPHIISIIDAVAQESPTAAGNIPIGGIAWAGDRGIQQVEVQVDDGAWQVAQLRTPPLSELIWVQWRYDWPPQSGQHTFRVRATDGTGTVQIGEESSVRPDGATGYHAVSATI